MILFNKCVGRLTCKHLGFFENIKNILLLGNKNIVS